jgi:PAS domain S-box-containing protein
MPGFGTDNLHAFWSQLPYARRGTLLTAVPVTCLLTSVVAFTFLQRSTEDAQKYVARTQQTIFQANRTLTALVDAETGIRGYYLTREEKFLEPYDAAIAILPDSLNKLDSLVQNNPAQLQQVEHIESLAQQEISLLKQNLDAVKSLEPTARISEQRSPMLVKAKIVMDEIRQQIADFSSQQELLLQQSKQHLDRQQRLTAAVLGASATIGFLGSLSAVYLFDWLEQQLIERQMRQRDTNVRLKAILDNVIDGIITINHKGDIESFNEAAHLIFGYEPSEVFGQNFKLLLANSIAGDGIETLNYFIGSDNSKIRCRQETIGQRQNGQLFPMELTFSEINLDNQRLYIAIVSDITSRMEREETLQKQAALLDLANDAIIVRDCKDRITYWNQGAERLYGWKKQEAIGKCSHELLQTEFPQPLKHISRKFLVDGYWRGELIYTKRDGTRINVASRWTLQVDDEREPMAVLEINNDITERKVAEEARRDRAQELVRLSTILAQTNIALEKRNQELDQFAYIVSHDLKAPLRAIANLSSWIEEDIQDQLNDETRHQMDLLRGRVHRMENLINGLLHYSRVGRVKTSAETVEVENLVAEVIDSLDPPATFTVTIDPGMPILFTERLLLEQVFANLISNAIKHHDKPQGLVTISVQEQPGFYEFAVADDGAGIDPQYHEKVFGIFQTLDSRDKVENTGIGLSLVKKIVESQGGTIRLESEAGFGATFRFTWPKEVEYS